MQLNFMKHLLRGLGISELPIIFTTLFKFFYSSMLHPKRLQVKTNCKKIRKN